MDVYQNALMTLHDHQDTSLHRQIMNDVDYLKEEKFHDWDQALKLAIRKNKRMFHDMMASYEDSTYDSTDVSNDDSTDDSTDESGEGGDDESIESVPESQ